MGLGCGAEVSDTKGNKVSGQSVRLTDEQRIDWLLRNEEVSRFSHCKSMRWLTYPRGYHVAECDKRSPCVSMIYNDARQVHAT
jgi:hypothetical protein